MVVDGAAHEVDVGRCLRVGQQKLAALGEAQEDVAGLDRGHRNHVLQAERKPGNKVNKELSK